MDRASTSLERPQGTAASNNNHTPLSPFAISILFSSIGDPESPETSTTTYNRELRTLRTIVGRGPAAADTAAVQHILFPSITALSQSHLAIDVHPSGQLFVQDLGSSNGTFLMLDPEPMKLVPNVMYQWSDCQKQRIAFGTRGALTMVINGPLPSKEELAKSASSVGGVQAPVAAVVAAGSDTDDDDHAPPPSALLNFQRRKSNQSDNGGGDSETPAPEAAVVVATDAQPSMTSLVSFTSTPPKEPAAAAPHILAATVLPPTLIAEDDVAPPVVDPVYAALPATLLVDSPPKPDPQLPATLLVDVVDVLPAAVVTSALAPTLVVEELPPASPPASAKRPRAASAEDEDMTPPPAVAPVSLRAKRARSEEATEDGPVPPAPAPRTPLGSTTAAPPPTPQQPRGPGWGDAPATTTAPTTVIEGPGFSIRPEIVVAPVVPVSPPPPSRTPAAVTTPPATRTPKTAVEAPSAPVAVSEAASSPSKRAPPAPPTAAPVAPVLMTFTTPTATKVPVWQYKTDLRKKDDKDEAWANYSSTDNSTIEFAYQAFVHHVGKKAKRVNECSLNTTYGVHFEDLVQFRFDDRSRQRPVRRLEK